MTRQYKPDYLEQAIYQVLDEISTETFVYAGQQLEEITPPYVLLTVSGRTRIGQDTMFMTDDAGINYYHGGRSGALTLLFVGDLCNERADDLVNALSRPTASAAFRKYGPVLHGALTISRQAMILDGQQFEQSCAVDVQFRTNVLHFETAGLIETVATRYTVNPGDFDKRGAFISSKPGTQPPAGVVLAVVIDPPDFVLRAGQATSRLPTTHVQPIANMASFSTSTSDPDIAEIIRPDAPAVDFLQLKKPGTFDYTVTVNDKAGNTISDTITLQII